MAIIKCKNVFKDYKVGHIVVHALKDINVEFKKGEFSAIVGPSGSGKSTLLNIIGCLDKATKGEVILNDIPIKDQDKNVLADIRRDHLGFVFQTFNLIPVLTAFENVNFVLSLKKDSSAEENRKKTLKILEEVGLKGLENRRPLDLSGGQQQRVAIARALVKEPALVLADEPTANLDSHTGSEIMQLMKDLNKKKSITFIFSTHDKMVMEHARRIINLRDGMIKNGKGGK
ncbi:MAG: ABC transporter ATP-binding protein [Spirochaetes bacterium]|nr:ABC transporter ATP-binding protein [Spirochaetota bacterium]